jgi:hypothetical protein
MSAYGTLHTNVPYAPSSKGQLSAAPIGQHFVKIVHSRLINVARHTGYSPYPH